MKLLGTISVDRNRSPNDQKFSARQILQKTWENNETVHQTKDFK
jgi:hypothetical protein